MKNQFVVDFKFKSYVRLLVIAAAVLLLAACSKDDASKSEPQTDVYVSIGQAGENTLTALNDQQSSVATLVLDQLIAKAYAASLSSAFPYIGLVTMEVTAQSGMTLADINRLYNDSRFVMTDDGKMVITDTEFKLTIPDDSNYDFTVIGHTPSGVQFYRGTAALTVEHLQHAAVSLGVAMKVEVDENIPRLASHPDCLSDDDGDGICGEFEDLFLNAGGEPDIDLDSVINSLDTDADGDGIEDDASGERDGIVSLSSSGFPEFALANQAPLSSSAVIDIDGTAASYTIVPITDDPNGGPHTYIVQTAPQHGTVAVDGETFIYIPFPAFAGTDRFTYEVTDKGGLSILGEAIVNVGAPNSPPEITLNGGVNVIAILGQTYLDQGATANDIEDGDLTSQIAVVNNVDTTAVGTYSVTYNVQDSSGLAAEEVVRSVQVIELFAPVISLNGESVVTLLQGQVYTDAGATASDAEDGDLSSSIIVEGLPINTNIVGEHTVNYSVVDSDGHAVQISRTINVVFNNPPQLALLGSNPVNLVEGGAYSEAGATATDVEDGDLTSGVLVAGLPIPTNTPGNYIVRYSVTDSLGKRSFLDRTVNVAANARPVITLLGDATVNLVQGDSYTDAGVALSDDRDSTVSLASSLIVGGDVVDTSVAGTYVVTYNVTDSHGKSAVEVVRTVNVAFNNPPVITLQGNATVNLLQGESYSDAGATASDAEDGDLTIVLATGGLPIDTFIPGTYEITYDVTDTGGKSAATVTRTVVVNFNNPPVITLSGSANIDIYLGDSFVDPGATASDVEDGDLTGIIVTSGSVNTAVLGSYALTYDVTDALGKAATQITRTVNVIPNGIPIITLLGEAVVTVFQGDSYTDAGATAFDAEDGDITTAIVTGGLPIDTSVIGSYTVTYDVTDSHSQTATQVQRTVNVVANAQPVITLTGAASIDVIQGASYTDAGATAFDAEDGNLTASIVVSGLPIDTLTPGSYTVTYNVVDSRGLAAAQVSRTVNVIFNNPPVITLRGVTPVNLIQGQAYSDAGVTAVDAEDGDITFRVVTAGLPIDTSVPGTYTVTYDVTDNHGKAAAQVTRIVNVAFNNPPVITLNGASEIDIVEGTPYFDAGASASDVEDGNLTGSIIAIGASFNWNEPGTKTITYRVTDTHGKTTEATRTVNVLPNDAPVISLVGDATLNLIQGETYTDPGVTLSDDRDSVASLQGGLVVGGPVVNTAVPGTYVVTYNVTDSHGKAAVEVTRTVNVVFNNVPVITLQGNATVNILQGLTYSDAGATASDVEDGDLSASIVTSGLPIDTSIPGSYSITYDVTDTHGKSAATVTRTVVVNFNNPPVISLTGSANVDVYLNGTYVDAGATASDVEDGDISASIVTSGSVNTTTLGAYVLTYDVTDSAGKVAPQVTRTVNVIPNGIPIITLAGSAVVTVFQDDPYTDAGATAVDVEDGDVTASIVTAGLPIDTSVIGNYTVTYNVADGQGQAAVQVERTVNVVANAAPVITLTGASPLDVIEGATYSDAGATALDGEDGDVTASIVVGGLPIDTSIVGGNTVTYDVNDSRGLAATQVTRTVNVVFNNLPVITRLGVTPVDLIEGDAYSDAGATAFDSEDGSVTASIVTGGLPIDTSTPGTYTVTYDVTDAHGKSAVQVTRTVNVAANNPPVITLNGAASVDVKVGDAYVDPGATASDVEDGDLTTSITTGGTFVDTSTPGSFTITYDVMDGHGLAATQVVRTINVETDTPPVITLIDAAIVEREVGVAYTDAGATASDTEDGNLTASITTGGTFTDTSIAGSYTITYDVVDSDGNNAVQVVRTINVVTNEIPVITLIDGAAVSVVEGQTYIDVGATASDLEDGDLTASIITTGLPINTALPGSYTVNYNVADGDGNDAIQISRTVNVLSDNDGDGLADVDESAHGADMNLADSDGDNISDGTEVLFGGDPASAVTQVGAEGLIVGQTDNVSVATSNTLSDAGGANNPGATSLSNPMGLAYDPVGLRLFVGDEQGVSVFGLNANGTPSSRGIVNTLGRADNNSVDHIEGGASGLSAILGQGSFFTDSTAKRWYAVADTDNHRILFYDVDSGVSNGMAASLVLGQPDMTSYSANQGNTTSACSDVSITGSMLNNPQAVLVMSVGTRDFVFVSDTDNDRVLVWEIPVGGVSAMTPGEHADFVLGQPGFTTRDTDATCSNDTTWALREPKGLVMLGSTLIVADSQHHRVVRFNLGANAASLANGMLATNVLGQTNLTTVSLATAGQTTLNAPSSVSLSGSNLFVSDNGNHRVVVYDISTFTNGMNATHVYGQVNFTDASSPSSISSSTFTPTAVQAAGDTLFITDGMNSRVLVFDISVLVSGVAATNLLGQTDWVPGMIFGSESVLYTAGSVNDLNGTGLNGPRDIAAGPANLTPYLFIADTENHRVLGFVANHATRGAYYPSDLHADVVIGQASMHQVDVGVVSSQSLNTPSGLAYDNATGYLWVADTANHRVLGYDVNSSGTAASNGMAASVVLGQADFVSSSASTTASNLNSPRGLALAMMAGVTYLAVADENNNRVLIYDVTTPGIMINGEAAAYVIGQADFTSSTTGSGAATFFGNPTDIALTSTGLLFAMDRAGYRVLMWDLTSGISNGLSAEAVIGQADFISNTSGTSRSRVQDSQGIAVDETAGILWLADTANNRALGFNINAKLQNGDALAVDLQADYLIGQPDYVTGVQYFGNDRNIATLAQPTNIAAPGASSWLYLLQGGDNRLLVLPNELRN